MIMHGNGSMVDILILSYIIHTRFRARVEVVTSDHNNRMIPIVFSRLVLEVEAQWGDRIHGVLLILIYIGMNN